MLGQFERIRFWDSWFGTLNYGLNEPRCDGCGQYANQGDAGQHENDSCQPAPVRDRVDITVSDGRHG